MEVIVCGDSTEETESGSELDNSPGQTSVISGESYVVSGTKDSHPGYTFQFHLLMLYATRALKLGLKDFRIATKIPCAGMFDDVIFSFLKERESGGRYFQFVQAKNNLKQGTNIIRPSQLLDENGGPFSLVKYFDSFRNIKQNPELMYFHDEVKSLVIFSNMDFQFGEPVGHFVFKKGILKNCGNDEIFGNELLKFKDDFDGRREVVLFLKNGIVSLPRVFANAVIGGQKLNLKNLQGPEQNTCIYKSYLRALTTEVLCPCSKSFKAGFVKGSSLSSTASHFRDELWFKYIDRHGRKSDETAFCSLLSSRTMEIHVDIDDESEEKPPTSKILAKCLMDLLIMNKDSKDIKVDEMDTIVQKIIDTLLDLVLINKGRLLVFDQGFIKGCWLPEKLNIFRESLKERMKNIGMEFNALEGYTFEIDHISVVSERYCGDRLELDVRQFLDKLTFSLNQPGITEMESCIKATVFYCLNISDASNEYGRFYNMMYSWAQRKDSKYLTENDIRGYFCERKRELTEGIQFNLRHPVLDFVGRDCQLEQIHEVLEGRLETDHLFIPRTMVICGPGGIGKSELAREYAKRHHPSHYDNIIWINSENRERLESSFKTLALGRVVTLEEICFGEVKDFGVLVQSVYNFFRGKKTLIVFDNVVFSEHVSKCYPKFLLGDDEVYVLMTTRNRDWKGFPILDLDIFSPEDAFEFVQLSLSKCPNWNDTQAREVAKKVSYFPLALKQACSYIEEMVRVPKAEMFRISDYITLFRMSSRNLLKCPFKKDLLNTYSEITYATMMVALEHIQCSRNGKTAIDLLNVITFLSPDSVEVDILRKGHPRFTTKDVDASLSLLQKLSILKVEGPQTIIHHLVRALNHLSPWNYWKEEEIIQEAIQLAEKMNVEHLMSVWESVSEHRQLIKNFSRIPSKIVEKLSKIYLLSVALEFMQGAIEVLTNHLGPEDCDTLHSRKVLGWILYLDEKYEEAAKIQKCVFEDQVRMQGNDQLDSFLTLYNYGVYTTLIGRLEESLMVFQMVVDDGSAVCGEGHSIILAAKNQIAELQERLGITQEYMDGLE